MDFSFLEGKKTYVVAVATVAYAIGGLVAGYLSFDQVIPLVLAALGLSGLRHGVVTQADMFKAPEVPVQTDIAHHTR